MAARREWGMSRRSLSRLILLLAAALAPMAASAQAWLPDQGAFNTTFIFNDVLNKQHWFPNGDTVDVGHTRSQTYGAARELWRDRPRSWCLVRCRTSITEIRGAEPRLGEPGPRLPGFERRRRSWHGALTDLRLGCITSCSSDRSHWRRSSPTSRR